MKPEYIIVQAGGKGTRMKHLTRNKPKALVPVNNLPILFHLFKKYPDSTYVIIGDYHYPVLERYLAAFAKVNYSLICASGHTGTCAGLRDALKALPPHAPFMYIWSDLILPDNFELPDEPGNYIGVAKDFPCRWKYQDNCFEEERSDEFGVAGLFFFSDTEFLKDVPSDGEFVRWLAESHNQFNSMPLFRTKEYGLLSEYEKIESSRCRPFNEIFIEDGLFVKKPLDEQGEMLAVRETAWYRRIAEKNFANIPHIVSYQPLKMEYIKGGPVYEYENLNYEEKKLLLHQLIDCLKEVHKLDAMPMDRASFDEAYIGKTFSRLEKVKKLVPFAQDDFVLINGRRCRNIFSCRQEVEDILFKYIPSEFEFIHGDCTFSNIMLREDHTPMLIDPRGYFGFTELCGDPAYDWAKLYYSVVGNYDQFNRKRFELEIGENAVSLKIRSNGWEDMEGEFFRLLEGLVTKEQIKIIHALIWLSLTTYAWEDYDSICGAFYNGLYYLEDALV